MTDIAARFASRNRSPLMDGLDVHVVIEEGEPIVRVAVAEKHLRSHNIAHGGLLCTVLDTAMGATAYAAMTERNEAEENSSGPDELVTSQLTIHFLRPAWNGETLIGRGTVLHHGAKTIVVRGDVTTEDGQAVASGSGTFMPVTIAPEPE